MQAERQQLIRSLFEEYIEMYAARDDRLTAHFSENFSGYTGGGDFLAKDKGEWVAITRLDFAQVSGRIRIEMLDLSLQDLSDTVVAVTALFHIHLPIPESILSSKAARLGLVFRLEGEDWKIVHSGISIPYSTIHEGEVYPIKSLLIQNNDLKILIEVRTRELEDANNQLQMLSNTDGLTGIANRRSFDHVLAQEWTRAQRAGTPLSLIMLDVDNFKHYNDFYGHLAGDDCLRALSQAMVKAGRRAGELVARYGGEEFIVLLPDTNEIDALEAARRIQQEVWSLALPHAEIPTHIVSFSMGVASLLPSQQQVPEDLVRLADTAMYHAKQSGRNCVQSAPD